MYQKTIYKRAALYLNLNMLFIPALTLTNVEPVINLLDKKKFDIAALLGDFYISNSGIFFVSILI